MASHPPPQRPPPTLRLYFAYGSNLHLGQMAKRCPESRYVGVAKLHHYQFQINNRGYANVVPSPGSCVEGIVYRLSLTDEVRLDKSEGVPTAYQKYPLNVELFTTPIEHVARAVPELAEELEALPRYHNSGDFLHHLRGQSTQVLVYLSRMHVQEYKPRDEYIDRMNAGIIDARKLGLTNHYIQHCLRHFIKDRALPVQIPTPARRNSEKHHQRSRESRPSRRSSLERGRPHRAHRSRSRSAGLISGLLRGGRPKNAVAHDTRDRHDQPGGHNNEHPRLF